MGKPDEKCILSANGRRINSRYLTRLIPNQHKSILNTTDRKSDPTYTETEKLLYDDLNEF